MRDVGGVLTPKKVKGEGIPTQNQRYDVST